MIDAEDTIVAIASPTTPALRGIVRLSGDGVIDILERLGIDSVDTSRATRSKAHVHLGLPLGSIAIDVMLWPTRRSYTGQPSAELHTYGSLPVLQTIVDQAVAAGGRAARPGEFTMRAFLAGRLDLTQAEAVLGVIEADGRDSLDHALGQLAGNLSRPLQEMRDTMLDLLADVEAGLDFVDEDIEFISDEALVARLGEILSTLTRTANAMTARVGGTTQVNVALRGEPNAGKSRLVNALADEEAAIVADQAGTTRDAVTIDVDIDSHPVRLIDTAGIEEPSCEIGVLSQRQAELASAQADIRIWCVDRSRDDFEDACEDVSRRIENATGVAIDLRVATKCDLTEHRGPHDWLATSAATGLGMEDLRAAIRRTIDERDRQETGSIVGTAARCGQSLARATSAVAAAIELTSTGQGHEFVAAELRLAVTSLGEVTGEVYTDDILDRVFGRFCIGK